MGECIRTEKEDPILQYLQPTIPQLTPQLCIESCSYYTFAGLREGDKCFCGNTIPSYSDVVGDSECSLKCSGDTKQMCGSRRKMNVYSTSMFALILKGLLFCQAKAKPS